jgi:dipeptidyl-peptidase 4
MRFVYLLLAAFAIAQTSFAQDSLTLDDCFETFKYYPRSGPKFQLMADGRHYTQFVKGELVRFDLLTQTQDSVLVKKGEIKVKYDEYSFSETEQQLLLRTETQPGYRHSVLATYYVFDLRTRKTVRVNESMPAQFAALSPDGRKVAYVMGNNVHVRYLDSGKNVQVTDNGSPNEIINGVPDWVYEEEFSVNGVGMTALEWNTDGNRLAFLQFDERKVPEFSMLWYESSMYPRKSSFKYPKVGTPNSSVSLMIYDLENDQFAECPDIKLHPDDYIVRIKWMNKLNLTATRLNRNQDTLDLVLLTPTNIGKDLEFEQELLVRETDNAYVELTDFFTFIEEKNQYVWASERSGYNHLYLYDFLSDNLLAPLTTGNFDVTEFYGVDAKNGKFYYQTATPTPMDRQIWEGDLSGGAPKLLTPEKGTSSAEFTPTFDHYNLEYSDANTPTQTSLRERGGKVVKVFENNTELVELRQKAGMVDKSFFSFKTPDGTELNGWMLKPTNMDPTKKYPVLFDVYGGPGSQTVKNEYDGYSGTWHQMLVQKGIIVVSVDNRGTGGRGRDFKKVTQLQLGRYETEDQIAAARYLGTLPYVDPGRIAIWGWSFGGYLSTSCVLKGADVFKAAVAVAPVTNWKWYDTAYTERYMHTTSDNAKGYEDNSPVNFAHLLRGDNYLLCHGIADDNVHFQHSTEMVNALVKSGKMFDTYYYPNRNHGIYGDNATIHLFTKITAFLEAQLGAAKP